MYRRVGQFLGYLVVSAGLVAGAVAQSSTQPQKPTSGTQALDQQKNAQSATQDSSAISGDQVTKPAGAKGTTLIGCLGHSDSEGQYILASMQHRAGVKVTGSQDLQHAVGSKVKLTGAWQTLSAESAGSPKTRRFEATQVEVLAQKCEAPTVATPISKKKEQEQKMKDAAKQQQQDNPQ